MLDVTDKAEVDNPTARRRAQIRDIAPGADWNEVEETILSRRSIRRFKGRQVPAHMIRRILEIARFSPSQGNCQPWAFVVIRDKEMIAEMEAYCVGVCKAMTAIKPDGVHPIPTSAIKSIAAGRFAVFHKAPTLILILMDKRGVGSPEIDIGVVGTGIVLAAQSLGLGTCWIGFSKLLESNKPLLEKLGITEPFEIAETISIGYPIGDPTINYVTRQTHEILWWENGRKEIFY